MKSVLFTCLLLNSALAFSGNAKIEADKLSGCSPLQVNFSAGSDANNLTYNWDFGNGTKSERKNASIAFIKPGEYKVKLLAGKGGSTEESTVEVTVFGAPHADFTATKTKACADDVITFNNKLSTTNNIVNYMWSFGDGKTITTTSPVANHTYKNAGQYDISLLVTDVNGCMDSKIAYSAVELMPKPVAAFKPSVVSSCSEKEQISFTNMSTGGNKLDYSWNFGNKNVSTEMNAPPPRA